MIRHDAMLCDGENSSFLYLALTTALVQVEPPSKLRTTTRSRQEDDFNSMTSLSCSGNVSMLSKKLKCLVTVSLRGGHTAHPLRY